MEANLSSNIAECLDALQKWFTYSRTLTKEQQPTHRFTDIHIAAILDHNLTSVRAGRLHPTRGCGLIEGGHVDLPSADDDSPLHSRPPAQLQHFEAQEDGDKRQQAAKAPKGYYNWVVESVAQRRRLQRWARG